jgi:pimeloyl-ACP methyl ester carboxylesterase
MAGWLRRIGYRTHGSGISTNIECSQKTVRRLERRVTGLAERYERPVSIIGHSRGGMIGRVLGVRHPDAVAQVITLGSPLVATLDDIHPLLRMQIRTLQRVQRVGGGALIGSDCEQSWEAYKLGLEPQGCCSGFWEDLDADVPAQVGFTSLYSRSDGVLHWRSCLDPEARHVEVPGSHCGMAVNARVFKEVATLLALADRRAARAPFASPAPRVRVTVPLVDTA